MQLEKDFEQKSKEFIEKYVEDIENLKKEFINTLSTLENKNSLLNKEIEDLQNYLANRPSRDEDLDEIRRLNEEIEKKEKDLKESKILLEQFRNELINREENYNGYFERKPKVGFVDPIKIKKEQNEKKKLKAIQQGKK